MPAKGSKKRFCVNGHDTFAIGRNKYHRCKQCARDAAKRHQLAIMCGKKIRKSKRFCIRGHDTFITGRHKANGSCKVCVKELCFKNREKILRHRKLRYEKNKEEILKKYKKYRDKHKVEINRKARKRYEEHKEEINEVHRKYYKRHKQKILKREQERRKKTKVKLHIRKYHAAYMAKRIKYDPIFKLEQNLRSRIRSAVKRDQRKGSAIRDLGCPMKFFKKYLESKFYDKMTWKNYGTYWVLDHVVALYKFDLTNRRQFKRACHYTNLQPLTIPDHKKKTAKEQKEISHERSRKRKSKRKLSR